MSLPARLALLRQRIDAASRRAGRDPESVRLLAVTKSVPAERVAEALRAGLRAFGENRVQEAELKIPQLAAQCAGAPPAWHCIGRLQRNKVQRAVALFDVVQSVDRVEIAHALERAAAARERPLDVFLQVNVDQEPQKAGVAPEQLAELAGALERECPHLRTRGLMAIPRPESEPERRRPAFARLRALRDELRGRFARSRVEELSMGMSDDFEIAIEEGATWVRIGTALFGARETPR